MYQLHADYNTLMEMPWETIEWMYHRHVQQLIDLQKEQNKNANINHFF